MIYFNVGSKPLIKTCSDLKTLPQGNFGIQHGIAICNKISFQDGSLRNPHVFMTLQRNTPFRMIHNILRNGFHNLL